MISSDTGEGQEARESVKSGLFNCSTVGQECVQQRVYNPSGGNPCVAYNKSTRYRRQNSPVSEREFLKIGKGHVEAK